MPAATRSGADRADLQSDVINDRFGKALSDFVRVAAAISNSAGLHNQDWGGHVYVCTGLRHPWGAMWPMLRHYR